MNYCRSEAETRSLGKALAQELPLNSVVCFFGDLGAGKTTFIKGMVEAVDIAPESVSSPTFTFLHIYRGLKIVYHFDLYRLADADEFLSMGFDEYFWSGGICCVEWSEKIESILPQNCVKVFMAHAGEECREIKIWRSISSKMQNL